MTSKDFAPYFRNGLLYLPQKTVDMLTDAGMDKGLAQAALMGLALDDHKAQIGQISRKLEEVLSTMEEDTHAFRALNSNDAQFMLTGKPNTTV
jgi:hypothetical protein